MVILVCPVGLIILTIIFFANLITFTIFVVRNHGPPRASGVDSAASANLMVTLLFRQENFLNLVYEIAVCRPHSAPLWLRRRLAKVFHYGGAHSGAGTAAVVWYIMYAAIATKDYIAGPKSCILGKPHHLLHPRRHVPLHPCGSLTTIPSSSSQLVRGHAPLSTPSGFTPSSLPMSIVR
uniref:Uncharacterized protein n=1 Tax=Moniliophthora roreri TaxID=221103 RepID=A0A0W0F059_MONRR